MGLKYTISQNDIDIASKMYNEGNNYKDIAKALDVSPSFVGKILKQTNVQITYNRERKDKEFRNLVDKYGDHGYQVYYKLKVFEAYGNKCFRCSLGAIYDGVFLNIHHINNDGAYERNALKLRGYSLHRKLYDELPNINSSYTVACYNCNWISYCEYKASLEHISSPYGYQDKEYHYRRQLKQYEELKLQVVSHYSNGTNKCVCCGFNDIRALTIDHIIPRDSKYKDGTSIFMHKYLIANNFPEGYQILCFNCNSAKKRNNICTHQIVVGDV